MLEIFDTIDISDILGLRDRVVMELLYATGIRVSELVNIKKNNLDLNNKSIVVTGKGNKTRIVFFNDVCDKSGSISIDIKALCSIPENETDSFLCADITSVFIDIAELFIGKLLSSV